MLKISSGRSGCPVGGWQGGIGERERESAVSLGSVNRLICVGVVTSQRGVAWHLQEGGLIESNMQLSLDENRN